MNPDDPAALSAIAGLGVGLQVYAFVWGAVWGSFLNAVIHRLPAGASLVNPPSACGSCGTGIRWFDNIPIVIDDGVVNTANYGSGYWTIWGGEYRVFDDGHDETTLIVRPKGDGAAIDTDLIDSDPIHPQTDWAWGTGAP